jgi:soluble lytic murein transglycosylase-like protein
MMHLNNPLIRRGMVFAFAVTLGMMGLGGAAFATTPAAEPALDLVDSAGVMHPKEAPVQISEAPASPLAAGRATDQFRKQAAVVAGYIANYNKKLAWSDVSAISDAIVQYSNRYGVDYRLLTSIIAVESSFRRDVVSSSGAIGMGQLKPDTAKWLGVLDPYDPVDNIAGTARFLSWLVRKYNGNLESALSAYYQGPGYVDRNGITPVCFPYLQKVNRALGGLM